MSYTSVTISDLQFVKQTKAKFIRDTLGIDKPYVDDVDLIVGVMACYDVIQHIEEKDSPQLKETLQKAKLLIT